MKHAPLLLCESIKDTFIWENSDYLKAWIILNFENKKQQTSKSLAEWAVLFGGNWTKSKVRFFFDLLQKNQFIKVETAKVHVIITILSSEKTNEKENITLSESTNYVMDNENVIKMELVPAKNTKNPNLSKKRLNDIRLSDVPEKDKNYFKITKAFQELFRQKLTQIDAPTSLIEKMTYTSVNDIRLIVEVDNYTLNHLRHAYKFLQVNDFWAKSILSTAKLRQHLHRILMEIDLQEKLPQKNKKTGLTIDEINEIVNSVDKYSSK